jgi:hypothetical protein
MSILKFIKRVCVQTAVYWSAPVKDGYGSYTFATPTEIKCRWEDKLTVITGANGEQEVCNASILVYQDLALHGYVYLGELTDLTILQKANPKLVNGAREIMYFEKVPLIFSTDKFVRQLLLK